jgi:hypothetical protein
MDPNEFTDRYEQYIYRISSIIRLDLLPIIEHLKEIFPLDLVTPSAWFQSENDALGYVWGMFIKRVKKYL